MRRRQPSFSTLLEELRQRLADLVELEEERIVAVRTVELDVLGIAARGHDALDDLA